MASQALQHGQSGNQYWGRLWSNFWMQYTYWNSVSTSSQRLQEWVLLFILWIMSAFKINLVQNLPFPSRLNYSKFYRRTRSDNGHPYQRPGLRVTTKLLWLEKLSSEWRVWDVSALKGINRRELALCCGLSSSADYFCDLFHLYNTII